MNNYSMESFIEFCNDMRVENIANEGLFFKNKSKDHQDKNEDEFILQNLDTIMPHFNKAVSQEKAYAQKCVNYLNSKLSKNIM